MKRLMTFWVIFGLFLSCFVTRAQAEDKYPNRPIELDVPSGAGGSADVAARCYSDELSKILGVPVNVVNRPGGSGIQGMSYGVNSKKDGYTIIGAGDTPLLIMPVISKEVPYDPIKDIIPIARFASVSLVFVVRNDSPFKTLEELVDYARKNPGKLKNGASGFGTEAYFDLQILCSKAKIKITPVPFKSGGETAIAILGGHVDMASTSVASLGQHIKSGKLRALAMVSRKRHPDFPDIPTTAELGYPEADLTLWTGVFVPAGVPQEVLDVLNPAVEKALKNPDVIKRATNAGMEVEYMGSKELQEYMVGQIKRIRDAAVEAGIVK